MAFFKKKKKGMIDFSIGDIRIIQNILKQVAPMRKKERKIVSIFGIAALALFVLLIATIIYKSSNSKTINLDPTDTISALTTNTADNIVTPIKRTNHITNTTRPTSTLKPTDTNTPTYTPKEEIEPWGQLIIEVDRKKDTLDVLEGINESNLDKCVGYMPGSAMPGEAGVCIFMGHRDTDFRILNKALIGDRITVVYEGKSYIYEIDKIEILGNSQIDYEIRNIPSIALVTCYPFNYVGSAPQQCVIYASLIS